MEGGGGCGHPPQPSAGKSSVGAGIGDVGGSEDGVGRGWPPTSGGFGGGEGGQEEGAQVLMEGDAEWGAGGGPA